MLAIRPRRDLPIQVLLRLRLRADRVVAPLLRLVYELLRLDYLAIPSHLFHFLVVLLIEQAVFDLDAPLYSLGLLFFLHQLTDVLADDVDVLEAAAVPRVPMGQRILYGQSALMGRDRLERGCSLQVEPHGLRFRTELMLQVRILPISGQFGFVLGDLCPQHPRLLGSLRTCDVGLRIKVAGAI